MQRTSIVIVCAVWLTGVLVSVVKLFLRWRCLHRFARRCHPVQETGLNALILDLTPGARTLRRVSVLQAPTGDSVGAPMTWGHWHAVLLLPADAGTWPHERLRVALLHELAHVRRGDWLTQTLGQALLCLYWYHPLVWLAYRRMHVEAEMACDDTVLLEGIHNADYAAHLLDVLKCINVGHEPLPVTVAMARVSHIGDRMQRILDARLPRRMSRVAFLASRFSQRCC